MHPFSWFVVRLSTREVEFYSSVEPIEPLFQMQVDRTTLKNSVVTLAMILSTHPGSSHLVFVEVVAFPPPGWSNSAWKRWNFHWRSLQTSEFVAFESRNSFFGCQNGQMIWWHQAFKEWWVVFECFEWMASSIFSVVWSKQMDLERRQIMSWAWISQTLEISARVRVHNQDRN